MPLVTVVIFALVYLGMALGRFPGLLLDRTGVALLGLIALLATEGLTLEDAAAAIDLPTITLLFALMILSAQFEGSGLYALCASWVTKAADNPRKLLAMLILPTSFLSALLSNDVVAFALTPLICTGLLARQQRPEPYLIALAAAANVGSAATLIGNPQNILIGQAGHLDFSRYLAFALPPVVASIAIIYLVILVAWRNVLSERVVISSEVAERKLAAEAPPLDRWQMFKGFIAICALVGLFFSPIPREIGALTISGLLLLSRRISSRSMIAGVDWHLLLLFACLFGITAAFAKTATADTILSWIVAHNLHPERIAVLAPLTLVSSNTIGNVPAVVLFMALFHQRSEGMMVTLALLSTFAGNFLLTGSLCNIIVAERAESRGAKVGFFDFARSGIPLTLLTMAVTCLWLVYRGVISL